MECSYMNGVERARERKGRGRFVCLHVSHLLRNAHTAAGKTGYRKRLLARVLLLRNLQAFDATYTP